MNKYFLAIGTSAALMLLTGCASTENFEPGRDTLNVRNENHVSSEEIRQAAVKAVKDIMTNDVFTEYLAEYKKEVNDPKARPRMKLAELINDTTDTDINIAELTTFIQRQLLNSRKVLISLAEGSGRINEIGKSRKLEDDDNFDQSTVAKRGTLKAARYVFRPRVVRNITNDGSRKVVVTTFIMEMTDIHTGEAVWIFEEQLGFQQKRGMTGW